MSDPFGAMVHEVVADRGWPIGYCRFAVGILIVLPTDSVHVFLNLHRHLSIMSNQTRPIVFMDINIGETPAGRIKMELFSDVVPKCVPLALFRGISCAECIFNPIIGQQRISDSCVLENIGMR